MSAVARLVLTLLFLDMRPEDALRLYATLAISVGGHLVAAFLLLWLLPTLLTLEERAPIEITVIEAAPEPELEPEAEPEPEPETEPEPVLAPPEPIVERVRPEPRPQPREPEPAPAEPPPEPAPAVEAIEEFAGVTLTNPTGESWQSNLGSGAPIEGPIGPPNAQVTGRRRHGQAGGTPGGTGEATGPVVVPASDLSRQPGPPNERLRELLRNLYPREAAQLGVEGHADVRVRVHPDGTVQPLSVVRETYEGFGEACRRALRQGGRWEPPLDREGRPVLTETRFRCGFTVGF